MFCHQTLHPYSCSNLSGMSLCKTMWYPCAAVEVFTVYLFDQWTILIGISNETFNIGSDSICNLLEKLYDACSCHNNCSAVLTWTLIGIINKTLGTTLYLTPNLTLKLSENPTATLTSKGRSDYDDRMKRKKEIKKTLRLFYMLMNANCAQRVIVRIHFIALCLKDAEMWNVLHYPSSFITQL